MKTLFSNRMIIAVSVITCLNFLSFSAKAFSGTGSGTIGDPYVVTTANQLNEVRNRLSANYKLTVDIDLTDWLTANFPTQGWLPIGAGGNPGKYFSGTFDGNGHVITGLWINRSTIKGDPQFHRVGLFGTVGGTVAIKNLGVIIATNKSVLGDSYVGGIVGAVVDGGILTMSSCYVQGNITTTNTSSFSYYAGGLIGGVIPSSDATASSVTLSNCYARGGTVTSQGDGVGGLIGFVQGVVNINISNCYAANTVVNADGMRSAAGILAMAGSFNGSATSDIKVTISNSVALNPSISGKPTLSKRIFSWNPSGAIITFNNNFAFDNLPVNSSIVTSGTSNNNNGLNKTSAELTTQATYEAMGWDFVHVWKMGSGEYSYPVLRK